MKDLSFVLSICQVLEARVFVTEHQYKLSLGLNDVKFESKTLGTAFQASLLLLDVLKNRKHQHNACTTRSQEIDTGNMHKFVY